ncbi:signal peptidase I [Streptococcus ictaluri]|uniref:Signal peptidase I n=1 Tax=Streptococcus ictaluri 707-05 TaxID=764299 RepID=G5JZV3_9STRE|nr:signal peptidase I [Streptococcus ictaluri]EHI71004.1 signal peptidase I [Streptococcus ictaluri 707-05]
MRHFIKEWGLFTLFLVLFGLSRLFLWQPVKVDGHSMDPTLADSERLLVLNHAKIDRFDIVVAREFENGQKKDIVKRVVGMPGDKIAYMDDTLYINGQKTAEPYLVKYLAEFKKDNLYDTYSYNRLFQQLAENSAAFTTSSDGKTSFEVTVPKGQYYLLGDDRIVSRDSREVGPFQKEAIVGEVKARFWPIKKAHLFKH